MRHGTGSGIALVRRPGPRLSEGIVTHIERRPVDLAAARIQHETYTAALRDNGFEVIPVEPADEHPDAVFVEDVLVVVDGLAVLTRPGAANRRGEVDGADRATRSLGLEVVRIEPPGTLDGGDVLQVGRTVYVGRSGRTNAEGIAQLGLLLRGRGRVVVPVELTGVLHLKSAVTALPDGALIGLPECVGLDGLIIPPEPEGAHVVPLAKDTVLLAASAPKTSELLTSRGLRTVPVDISEFEKLEGCVTCLSVLI